ncbi:CDP-diacylglycerol--serine O-phosphatidyltransferase [Selenomonas sp. TAMA-11512]|uniref:CDP-diacylglycerol--serine O-phosphatidyltransferase n=1 Tax=Selenomonas sp. TAMA-11512 TaxID=3095337 RepID=UPI00308B98C7|nr:CDP-diacylglycerol--serine O-phosphatidyltransferase [Selenomonas sp. TAMA-11512]
MRSLIPNTLTSLNLVFGMCSMMATYQGDYVFGAVFILLALVADGLDGRAARAFGVSGELGKELDSLCDLGSFGIAPAFLAYSYCLAFYGRLGQAVAIIFALCGMWRLARFNVNADVVHGYFMGLAIPAGGCVVATSIWLFSLTGTDATILLPCFPAAMVVVSYLMVSGIHYPNFKGDGGEKIYFASKVFALLVFAGILYLGREAIVPAIFLGVFGTYMLFGVFNYALHLVSGK